MREKEKNLRRARRRESRRASAIFIGGGGRAALEAEFLRRRTRQICGAAKIFPDFGLSVTLVHRLRALMDAFFA